MNRMSIRLLPVLALALASSGCIEVAVITAVTASHGSGSSSTSPSPSSTPPSSSYAAGTPVIASDAQLGGTMGDIAATDTATVQSDSEAVVQLDVHQNDAHGWMMARIESGIPFTQLEVGRTYDSTIDSMLVIGCSGPTDGNYTFDSHATFASMQIEQGPTADDRVANVQLEFEDSYGQRQHVAGRFNYRAR